MNADQKLNVVGVILSTTASLAGGLLLIILPGHTWAEIPAGADVPTGRDYVAQEARFLTRVVVEPYLARRAEGESKRVDDEPGEQFLRLWVDMATKGFDDVDLAPLVNKGKQAVEAGCNDAMFSYCYGRLMHKQVAWEESAKHLKFALDNLESSGYDASFSSWAANYLVYALRYLRRHDETPPLVDREIEYLRKTVAEGPYLPDEQQLLYRHNSGVLANYPIEQVKGVVEQIDKQLYPWFWHMAIAQVEVREAWQARGGGWASEVTEEGWKGFAKHMEAARDHLNEAWNLNPGWPESATEMITVAMAGHAHDQESPREWFDRAVAAQLDYKPAYTAYMWSLMPRWGGSHEALYALGRECLATKRFDTHVPYFFLEAFESIVNDIGSTLDYYKAPGVYEDLQSMADGYLAEPSMEWHHHWYRSLKVAVAARCGRWDDARKFLVALEREPHENAFARLGLQPDAAIGEIYARSGELAKQNEEAERLAADGKYEQAKLKYEALASKTGDQQRVTTFFRGRLRGVEFDRDFAEGQWIALPLDERLTGWRNLGGKWTVDDHGRLIGEAQTNGLLLMYEKKLGTRFELRGEALVVAHTNSQCNMGVYFGQVTGRLHNSFRIFVDDDYAAVLSHDEPLERKSLPVENMSSFRVARWDNAITAHVNNELVASDVEIEPYGEPSNEVIALGGRYWYQGPIIRFENLEIRRLEIPPTDAADEEGEAADAQAPAQDDDPGL